MRARDLQNLLNQDVSIEDLILGKSALSILDQGFQDAGVPTPEWVIIQLETVTDMIFKLVSASLKKQLREAKARRSALATADEKRQNLDTVIAELEKKLG
jgi:hypothetical protein